MLHIHCSKQKVNTLSLSLSLSLSLTHTHTHTHTQTHTHTHKFLPPSAWQSASCGSQSCPNRTVLQPPPATGSKIPGPSLKWKAMWVCSTYLLSQHCNSIHCTNWCTSTKWVGHTRLLHCGRMCSKNGVCSPGSCSIITKLVGHTHLLYCGRMCSPGSCSIITKLVGHTHLLHCGRMCSKDRVCSPGCCSNCDWNCVLQ